jgi:hypothetical protein
MKVVKVRSPFIIEVAETGQIGSKIVLAIWQKGNAVPTSGTGFYTLSKSIPSTTQISNSYNVSNYVKEFIDNIRPFTVEEPDVYDNNEWVNFRVTRYKLVGTTYTSLDTTDYVGVNGFTNYSDGKQTTSTSLLTPLLNNSINTYYWNGDADIQNYNFIVDKLSTSTLSVRFENLTNTNSVTYNLQNGVAGIFNYSIPISIVINAGSNYATGCKVTVSLTPTGGTPVVSFITFAYPTEECKYTPVRCSFVNRYGGWQDIIFFKQQTNTVAVKGTDYKLMPSAISYNTSKGQVKSFNINGTQTIKLNTGFVDENYSELITDLLLSETVLLDAKPVTVKTQGSDLKTSLKDRLINYEIDFEYAYNLINDVV